MGKKLTKIDKTKIDFLKETEDKAVIFTCPHAEIDVPQDYFDKSIAEMIGKDVNMFGLFEIKVYDTEDPDEHDKFRKIFYKHFGMVFCSPSSIVEKRDDNGEKIMTLVFKQGDTFIKNTMIAVDTKVATKMLDLMTLGYLPPVFPYEEIAQYWTDVNTFNGVKIGSMSQASIELIVSEVARDPRDPSKTFRQKLRDDPKTDRLGWKLINIRQIPRYSSTFASISSGDPKGNLISNISRQRTGGTNKETPVEDSIL